MRIKEMKKNESITTQMMFQTIEQKLKLMPEFNQFENWIDYFCCTRNSYFVYNINQLYPIIVSKIEPGGNEGIYIDFYLEYLNGIGGRIVRYHLGTVKTLDRSIEGFIKMGGLAGLMTELGYLFLNENSDLFKDREEFCILDPIDGDMADEVKKREKREKLLKLDEWGYYHYFEDKNLDGGIFYYGDELPEKVGEVYRRPFYCVEVDRSGKPSKAKHVLSFEKPKDKTKERIPGFPVRYKYFADKKEAEAFSKSTLKKYRQELSKTQEMENDYGKKEKNL